MVTPETINYVKQQLREGFPMELVKSNLLAHGWTENDFNLAYAEALRANLQEASFSRAARLEPAAYYETGMGSFSSWLTGLSVIFALGVLAWFGYQKYMAPVLQTEFEADIQPVVVQPRGQTTGSPALAAEQAALDERLEELAFMTREFAFQIHPPKGWVKQEKPYEEAAVSFYPNFKQKQIFLEVSVPAAAQGQSLDKAAQQVQAVLKKTPGLKLLNSQKVAVRGEAGYTYETEYKGRNSKILVMVLNDEVSLVTASAPSEQWDGYKEILGASFMSFRP